MAAIRDKTGTVAELVAGGGGIFDIIRDGEKIYSKTETGRFPTDAEAAELFNS